MVSIENDIKMKNNPPIPDPNTEFETSTLAYALLKGIKPNIAEDFKKEAFQIEQLRENSETILSSLPSDFVRSLIQISLPKTNYPSLIHNYGKFKL